MIEDPALCQLPAPLPAKKKAGLLKKEIDSISTTGKPLSEIVVDPKKEEHR